MKKICLLLISICFATVSGYADKPVKPFIIDFPKLIELLREQIADEMAYLQIQSAQKSQIESQNIIIEKLAKIDTLETKMQNYRSNLQDIMLQANSKEYIDSLVQDIADKQTLITKVGSLLPQFNDITNSCNKELNQRAIRIIKYIDNCGKLAGLKGQLDNKERTDMTLFVAKELQDMRTVAIRTLGILETALMTQKVNDSSKGLYNREFKITTDIK